MSKTWRRALWALALSFAIAAVTLFLLYRFVLPLQNDPRTSPPYTIGVWEGQVAVFEGDQEFPMQVFETYVSTLPAELQQQVRAGVPAADADELSLLLEDFTG